MLETQDWRETQKPSSNYTLGIPDKEDTRKNPRTEAIHWLLDVTRGQRKVVSIYPIN